jgi:hypothetical protein
VEDNDDEGPASKKACTDDEYRSEVLKLQEMVKKKKIKTKEVTQTLDYTKATRRQW